MTEKMTYPRYKNGYVDDGHLINNHSGQQTCPNCGSTDYRETVSLEECSTCGLQCDYWGKGTNDIYDNMLDRKYEEQCRAEELEQEENERRWQQYDDELEQEELEREEENRRWWRYPE